MHHQVCSCADRCPMLVSRDGTQAPGYATATQGVVPSAPAWPLFYEGDRRTRFAYAIFALNKVREKLLQAGKALVLCSD